jgi:hypothetical protein
MEKQSSTKPVELDIYTRRILAKFSAEEEIFFGVNDKGKLPVEMCVFKKNDNAGINSLCDVRMIDYSIKQNIICDHKARFSIKFKVSLFVTYEDDNFGTIILPEDNNKKLCFNTVFPVNIDNSEALIITKDDFLMWIIDVPFDMFNSPVPPEKFDDPTFQADLSIKAVRHDFNVFYDCSGPSNTSGTLVNLSIYADLTVKLTVNEDIIINGIPIDL